MTTAHTASSNPKASHTDNTLEQQIEMDIEKPKSVKSEPEKPEPQDHDDDREVEDHDLEDPEFEDQDLQETNSQIEQRSDRMIFTTSAGKSYEFFAPSAHDLLGINYADLFGGETQALMTFLTKLCPEFTQKTARHLSFKDIIQLISGANIFLGKQLDNP